jgi:hypothetical protein
LVVRSDRRAAAQAGWLVFDSVRRGALIRARRAREVELLDWKIASARAGSRPPLRDDRVGGLAEVRRVTKSL